MAKRRVVAWKYFHGDVELTELRWFYVAADGSLIGWTAGGGYSSDIAGASQARFGLRPAAARDLSPECYPFGYRRPSDWLPVDRHVRYLTKPDPHECDFRCQGGMPGGECWCQCGGRNHGRRFVCDIAA